MPINEVHDQESLEKLVAEWTALTLIDNTTPIRYANTMDTVEKKLLRERIETKIEEHKESREAHYAEHSTEGIMAYLNDTGIISGLQIALDLLEES